MSLSCYDEFAGFGGSSQGLHAVPGLDVVLAANHAEIAIEVHSMNFPAAEHYLGDITRADLTIFPRVDFFWASPACPPWSNARGKRRDFDKSTQGQLFEYLTPEQLAEAESLNERRALMEEVPRYLRTISRRGKPVLAGVVENVTEVTKWDQFGRWRREVETSDPLGYKTRVIALNSMHARGRQTPRAPQSRDRFYMAFWHRSLGRDPDWDKWLRPRAWCPQCEAEVDAVQQFKRPGAEMGRYRAQYVYRCPRWHKFGSGRQWPLQQEVLEPYFLPASAAIDWTLPGERIGDRAKPLADKTRARIAAGIRKYARPISLEAAGHTFERQPGVRTWPIDGVLTTQSTSITKAVAVPPMLMPAGGTWNDAGQPVTEAMRTRTTRETDGILVPPLLVPVEGRDGKEASSVDQHLRTQTTRNETGVLVPPLVMRNNTPRVGDDGGHLSVPVDRALGALTTAGHQSVVVPPFFATLRGRSMTHEVDQTLTTISASGAHHGMVIPPFVAELRGGGSESRPVTEAMATITASGNHHGLVTPTSNMEAWAAIYGYDSGTLRDPSRDALPTQTTIQGDGLLAGEGLPEVDDCEFRMLGPDEIHIGSAFMRGYLVKGTKRARVRGYGNAVTPPVAEVLGCALVECITGEAIER